MKKLIGVLLVSVLLLTGCGGEKESEPIVKNDDPVKEVEQVQENNNLDVKVNGITKTDVDEWDELEDGMELILVDITLKNNTDAEYEFNPNFVQLIVDGESYTVTDKNPKDIDKLNSRLVKSDEEVSGIVVFELEKDKEYEGIIYDDFNTRIDLR